MMRRGLRLAAFLGLAVLLFALPDALTLAAEGGYLSGYTEPDPRPTGVSWWSTLAYLFSLLAVFAFVLGPNRSVCIVELAERVFVLGVTEHSITLLREITDPEEIERLHRSSLAPSGGVDIFSSQMGTLEQLAKRIPSLFRDGGYRR